MPQLLIGLLILAGLWLAVRWFVATPPAVLLKSAGWLGVSLALVIVVGLVISDRIGWALATLAGTIPWLLRLIQVRTLWRQLKPEWMGRARSAAGSASTVETPFLRMSIDHDSQTLSGEVLIGSFAGRALHTLSLYEALALRRQCAADPQSVQLLEAWLDRCWADWRADDKGSAPPGASVMGEREARDILGVAGDASPEEIKVAYRRLMARVHPDHGGSDYLAAQINRAKDVLLGE